MATFILAFIAGYFVRKYQPQVVRHTHEIFVALWDGLKDFFK